MSLFGALGSIAGGILGYSANKENNKNQEKLAEQNRQFQYKMMLEQMGYNERMMDKQNEYNSPAAMRARLEEAGYSPYSPYFGMNASESASAQGITPPSGSVATTTPFDLTTSFSSAGESLDNIGNFISSLSESKIKDLQSKYEEARLIEFIKGAKLDNEQKNEILDSLKRENKFGDLQFWTRIATSEQSAELVKNQALHEHMKALNTQADTILKGVAEKYNKTQLLYLPSQLQNSLITQAAQAFSLYSSGQASLKQAALYVSSKLEVDARRHGINISNKVAEEIGSSFINSQIELNKASAEKTKFDNPLYGYGEDHPWYNTIQWLRSMGSVIPVGQLLPYVK